MQGSSGERDETRTAETGAVDSTLLQDELPAAAAPGREPGPGDPVGRYTLRALIGSGGMGAVYAAHDSQLGRDVAVKLIRPDGRGGLRARARLLREARSLARLHHPNVVMVHDAGSQGAQVYIAMELVDGTTMGHWLRDAPRRWREILAAFLAAGRGLAAAHAVGIVHRDFKPENVIVGDDRVVVVDFGLARDAGDAPLDPVDAGESSSPDSPDEAPAAREASLTRTGERLGTPLYMAPEQRAGAAVTARADQYSFCVSAWGALHGKTPAAGEAPRADRPEVPGWVNTALLRGLATDPAARWPSMAALITVLSRDPRAARRRIFLGVGAAALIAAAIWPTLSSSPPDPCAGAAAAVAPIWDGAARARVTAAFARTGQAYAADTFARVDRTLQARMGALAGAHRETCEATHVRHEQSEALLDLRMACLRRAREDAATVVTLLGEADGRTVDRAVVAVAGVADPAPCADAAALRAIVPAPRDPEAAREAGVLWLEARRIFALSALGRGRDALAAAGVLVPRARALGHPPVLAVALLNAAGVEAEVGDLSRAIDLAYEAVAAAEKAHTDFARAEAASLLVFAIGYKQRRFAEGEALGKVAEGATTRAGDPPSLRALLDHRLGSMLEARGDNTAALARYVSELGWAMRDGGWPSRPVSIALNDLRDAELGLGDAPAALRTSQVSVHMLEELVGKDHPWVATALSGTGVAALTLGDLDAAGRAFARALAIVEPAYGPDTEFAGIYAQDLAEVRLLERKLDEAAALIERAARIFERIDARSPRFVSCLDLRAQIAMQRGALDEAFELITRALALRIELEGPESRLTGVTSGNLGTIQRGRGRLAEARAAYERQLAIFQKALGASHVNTAVAACQLAGVLVALGQSRAGVALCEPAVAVIEKAYGAASPNLVDPRTVLAEGLLASGDRARALALAERADAAAGPVDPDVAAAARYVHAQALAPADHERACALAGEARALAAPLVRSGRLPAIVRWLDHNRCD